MFVYYMVLFITSAQHDNWNWVILLWTFVIGMPRIVLSIMLLKDSIQRRKWYSVCMMSTTAVQITLFIFNQIMIFSNDLKYCDKVYAVEYMVVTWDIYCDWAITLYEIG